MIGTWEEAEKSARRSGSSANRYCRRRSRLRPGGRPRLDDELALNGILFVLRTGIPFFPRQLGLGGGMTCWRRLRDWQAAGVWDRLDMVLLEQLRGAGQLDLSRASLDRASVPDPGGSRTAPKPTDCGKLGSKRHLVTDRQSIPLDMMVAP